MKKLIVLVLVMVLVCLQLFSSSVVWGVTVDADDIEVSISNALPAIISEDQIFDIKFSFTNSSADDLSDITFVMDSSSSFQIVGANTIKLTGNLNSGDHFINPSFIKLVYKGSGKELKFTLKYHNDITADDCIQSMSIYISNAYPTDNTPQQPVDTTKYVPRLSVISGTAIPTVYAGGSSTLTFPVKNTGLYDAKKITASLETEDKSKMTSILGVLNLTKDIELIASNTSKEITFDFKVLSTAPEGTYAMKLSYQFNNPFNDTFTTSETVYIKIQNDNSVPRLVVSSISTTPDSTSGEGIIDLKVNISNLGSLTAKDVKITLKGLKSGGYTTYNNTEVRYINNIAGSSSGSVTYKLSIPSKLSNSGDISVKIDFRDDAGNQYSEENQIFITNATQNTGKPQLVFDNILSPQKSIKANQDFTVSFNLTNIGKLDASNVKVWLTSDKEIVSKSLSTIMLDSIKKGQSRKIEFKLFTAGTLETRNYPLAINVEYEDVSSGEAVKYSALQYVGVFAENGDVKSTPRLIIDKYSFDPVEVKAGEDFNLITSFLNTSKAENISNIKITFVSEDGTFTPTNSSNTFFIEGIGIKNSIEKRLLLHVKPDAEPKSYALSVTFDYEDSKGTAFSSKEVITIPVKQNPRLVTGQISMPPETYVGQPLQVYIDFYNMGKSTLYNLIVKLEGDFDGQNLNYFVGNFEPGRSDSYDNSVLPRTEGALKGNVVFSFEDAAGKTTEIKKEFNVNVMKMPGMDTPSDGKPGMDTGMGGEGGDKNKFNITNFIIPGVIVFVVAAVVVGVILRKKSIKRKEMSLDE